jgi:hypothetical protein
MSTATASVSDMLVTVKAREIQRALFAEMCGDQMAARSHFLAAAYLELVLARDYEEAGDTVAVYRSRLSSASCLWRGGEIEKGRRALAELMVQQPDRAPAIQQAIAELSRDYPVGGE